MLLRNPESEGVAADRITVDYKFGDTVQPATTRRKPGKYLRS